MSIFESDRWSYCEKVLVSRLSEPGRFYHNVTHVEDCLKRLDEIPDLLSGDKELLTLAIWFHDVIYDPTRSDNEAESAAFARSSLDQMNVDEARIAAVVELIEITEHRSEPKTEIEKRMVDIDLSILGRDADSYQVYANAIRDEYRHVSKSDYRAGRSGVLQQFLDRDRIFRTDYFREKYEARAQENLELEIVRLDASSG